MSKDEHGLTPLQAVIKETIEKHPALDDKEIALMVFNKRYPDDEYEGKDPSHTYVGKMRKRQAILGKPPEFIVEVPEEPEEPEEYIIEEGETEAPVEPEIPFPDDFEIPDDVDEPLTPPEITDGFTLDDTEFLLCFTFDKIGDWTGYDGWRFSTDSTGRLTDPSEKRFAGLTHRMMEKYMPDILDEYFLEFMFCYTGIMLIGAKGKGYRDYKRGNKPIEDIKDVESTVVEKPPEEESPDEIPEAEDEELPAGAKAKGESGFMKRLKRQTP